MSLQEIINNLPQIGFVEWIGIRPIRAAAVQEVSSVEVSQEEGLIGDHYNKVGGARQVTLIQAEHLETVAKLLKINNINPVLTRRNILVSGINLLAFADRTFQIGEVVLEMTGFCHPCSKMEANLGSGGYNAMRGHGGITAKVIQGGIIKIGDQVKLYQNG
ncbi:MAG: MOSC domain-containing protein [Saprospiraceae bacterium]|nr:MOSC domain-containing protein [Saprospiraceae bacterium]